MYPKDWERYNINSTDLTNKLLQFIYLKWTASGKSDLYKYQTGNGAPQNTLTTDRADMGPKLDASTAIPHSADLTQELLINWNKVHYPAH